MKETNLAGTRTARPAYFSERPSPKRTPNLP